MEYDVRIRLDDISWKDCEPPELPYGLGNGAYWLQMFNWWIKSWRLRHKEDASHVDLGGEA